MLDRKVLAQLHKDLLREEKIAYGRKLDEIEKCYRAYCPPQIADWPELFRGF